MEPTQRFHSAAGSRVDARTSAPQPWLNERAQRRRRSCLRRGPQHTLVAAIVFNCACYIALREPRPQKRLIAPLGRWIEVERAQIDRLHPLQIAGPFARLTRAHRKVDQLAAHPLRRRQRPWRNAFVLEQWTLECMEQRRRFVLPPLLER